MAERTLESGSENMGDEMTNVAIGIAADKVLVREGGSTRHLWLRLVVSRRGAPGDRAPVSLALVVDRSGSMSGEKLDTAKKAALAVLEGLDERDTASVVVFDNEIDTILKAGPVTPERRSMARELLGAIQARSSTALHQGWLTGCGAIASSSPLESGKGSARCFLLTDGLANVGEADPERIASEAAGIRANAGISTSTFGIGIDYDEGLLGPMAVAGGGQFHHLRDAAEIARTFIGELGEIMSAAARDVRVEIETDGSIHADLVSEYWTESLKGKGRMDIAIGDLMAGEERQLVVRLEVPARTQGNTAKVRIRVSRRSAEGSAAGQWNEITFRTASSEECDSEERDRRVLHWMGLHHAKRAEKLAADAMRRNDTKRALAVLSKAVGRLSRYAEGDSDLESALADLRSLQMEIKGGSLSSEMRHEVLYSAQLSSRGQRDLRGGKS